MLCRLFFRFISKLKLILLILISLNLKFNLKNKSATEPKRERRNQLNPRREIRQKSPSSNVLQQISLHIREFRQNPVRHTLIIFLLSHCNPLIHNVWQPS